MSGLEIRIVQLEPMRVACAHGFGESPKGVADAKSAALARPEELPGGDSPEYRNIGFNDLGPSACSPNYGYDVWITVGSDAEEEGGIEIFVTPQSLTVDVR